MESTINCLLLHAAFVASFNIVWLIVGLDYTKKMYNFKEDKGFSAFLWVYSATGLIALIIALNL